MFNKAVYFWFMIFCFAFVSICAGSSDERYKEGELIVRFAPKAKGIQHSNAERNQILDSLQIGKIKKSSGLVPGLTLVQLPENLKVKDVISKLHGKKEFLYVEPNYEVQALRTPYDSYFNQLWGLHNPSTPIADINAPEAWDWNTSSNVIVAVTDTGIDYTHPELAANMWQYGSGGWHGYDFCNHDNDPIDDKYHGTHVAGIIGALGNNYQGVTGVCWNAQIMSLKFLNLYGTGYDYDAIDAIEFAIDHGAKIINASWGGGDYTQSLHDAIDAAGEAGALFIAAAGNSSGNNDTTPIYPASYDCENIISVMATNNAGQRASYSCYGATTVDLAAPGGEGARNANAILSTFPTYWTYLMNYNLWGYYSYHHWNTHYDRISGTSMAAPYVSGACALVWGAHPNLTHLQVKDAIMQSVDQLASLNGLCVSGGRLNVGRALYSAEGGPIYLSFINNSLAALRPDDLVTYTIAYHYNNFHYTQTQNDVVLTAQLPAEVLHTDVIATGGGTYNSETHTITWNLGSVGPGNSGSVSVTARVGNTIPSTGSLTAVAAITSPSSAQTSISFTLPWYRVRIVGGGWFDSIGSAITAAVSGETVEVFPGTYYETIDYGGKAITIRGSDPNNWDTVAATIVDANFNGNVVEFTSLDEGPGRVIEGLTLRNTNYADGSGVYCSGATSPVVSKCIIENNANGITIDNGSCRIEKCIIKNNYDAGVLTGTNCGSLIRSNIIAGNGHGIITGNSSIVISNTIVKNQFAGIDCIGTSIKPISNCILWANGTDMVNCSATYSCISNGDTGGLGNISVDPKFVNAAEGDYHISDNSPCINAGDRSSGSYNSIYLNGKDIDNGIRDSNGCIDIGADEIMNPSNGVHILGGCWYPTISSAIAAAADGNVIEVIPRAYYESFNYGGKAITIRGTDPNNWKTVEATRISSNSGNIVEFTIDDEGPGRVLEGVNISSCIYSGIYCFDGASPAIRKCIIERNITGIGSDYGSPIIEQNIIRHNSGTGLLIGSYSYALIKNNMIYNNDWGIQTGNYSTVIGNTVVDNRSGGINCLNDILAVKNCIVWDNVSNLVNCIPTYCCFSGGTGTNISCDPCFVEGTKRDPRSASAAYYDFHLKPDSPCINAADPNTTGEGESDIDNRQRILNGRVDIGADETISGARVYIVGGAWYDSISSAITGANDGDTIEVPPGVYYENINYNGKAITIRGTDPANWEIVAATIIDGGANGTVVEFINSEDACSVLSGLTITNGRGEFHDGCYAGGGIFCSDSSPKITRCIIKNNGVRHIPDSDGGGIACYNGANPEITNCIISDNTSYYSGGISIWNSSPKITSCIIEGNRADYGGGIYFYEDANAVITNCTIAHNSAGQAGGVYVNASVPLIRNTIIWGNEAYLNPQLVGTSLQITYSDIQGGYSGTGNINSDPCFVDADVNDLHLALNSPCINAGDRNGMNTGGADIDNQPRIQNGRVDTGAYEVANARVHIIGGAWYESINTAITAAVNNNVIEIPPGTYYENCYTSGKTLTLRGTDPNDWRIVEATIIDGSGNNECVAAVTANSLLEGLTLRNGDSTGEYSAVICFENATVRKCFIENGCSAVELGDGTVAQCIIGNNSGVAIYSWGTSYTIKNNIIFNNSHGFARWSQGGTSAQVINNTIADNLYGIYCARADGAPVVKNCILSYNDYDLINCSPTYSCFFGATGTNIDAYPFFVNYGADYHIQPNSPCINAGDPNGVYIGQKDIDDQDRIYNSRVDMGADEYWP